MKVIYTLFAAAVALWLAGATAREGENSHEQGAIRAISTQSTEGVKEMEGNLCPVMGRPINKKYSYVYKGTRYFFCCPACVASFKADPEKYIQRMPSE